MQAKIVFTFIDLFSGIGGFRIPLEELGGKCLGFSEIDKHSIDVYKKNFGDIDIELGDITKLNKLPFNNIDLIVGGIPCQAWSGAGKMKGFDDPRGRLWFDAIRLVKENKPKAFIFENVKGLIDPRNRASLDLILSSLRGIGYTITDPQLLNSSHFGLSQNRERVFIVGLRNDLKNLEDFKYPEPIKKTNKSTDFFTLCDTRNGLNTVHSWDIIQTSVREKEICFVLLRNRRKKIYGNFDGNPLSLNNLQKLIPDLKESELNSLVSKNILRLIDKNYDFVNSKNSSGINGIYRVYLPGSNNFPTLTATGTKDMIALNSVEGKANFIDEIINKKLYRPISVKEAGNLQGFPDWFIAHDDPKVARKQFGNAVSVPVIFHLGQSLIKTNIFANETHPL